MQSQEDVSAQSNSAATMQMLWAMLVVSGLLTVTQLTCGFIGNSLSLVGDGALMAMDAISYAVGLYVEKRKCSGARDNIAADQIGAAVSIALLFLTTCWLLFDVVDRLFLDVDGSGDPTEDVSAELMVTFTAVNLVADGIVLLAVWRCGLGALLGGEGGNMNFLSALAHLAADALRGVAVLLCGILAMTRVVNPLEADAYCSLFVCVFVLSATLSLSRALLKRITPTAYETFDAEDNLAEPTPMETNSGGASPGPSVFGVPDNPQ